MIKYLVHILFLSTVLTSCHSIETSDTLDKKTISKIKELGPLDEDERILKYYSNFEEDKAGNFFTDKRIAHYWIDQHDAVKTDISFAFYEDIISIDANLNVHDFDIPYMTVRKRDSTTFKVFIDGTYKQKNDFFAEAINIWHKKNSRIR